VTAHLLATFGVYGGIAAVAFVAGLFPLVSIEVFLVGLSVARHPAWPDVAVWALLAATGHQIAKTMCYAGATNALERGRIKARVEALRGRIERWNRYPHTMLALGAAFGLPPLYILAFVAHPIMRIRFVPFTAICFAGRLGRYAVLAAIPLLA
jgi:membrane protein YqaA with SNARE-associated domain